MRTISVWVLLYYYSL